MNSYIKKYGKAMGCGLLLIAFTLYVLADTFLLTKVYTVVEDQGTVAAKQEQEEENTTAEDSAVSTRQYEDDQVEITLTEYREHDTTIYVADIQVASADVLKTAFAKAGYGKNVTAATSEIAESVQAILAINGDYYGAREAGYVIRNGVIYRDTKSSGQEDLVIYEDGTMEVICEDEVTAAELAEKGAKEVLSFGPGLVENGAVTVSETDEVGKAMESNPRTAIGMIDTLHYLFVVSDGRTKESEGLSLLELAQFMEGLGAETAYNLDGGGSSTMYFQGEVINQPTTNGRTIRERSVSDIVYIGK